MKDEVWNPHGGLHALSASASQSAFPRFLIPQSSTLARLALLSLFKESTYTLALCLHASCPIIQIAFCSAKSDLSPVFLGAALSRKPFLIALEPVLIHFAPSVVI